MSASCLRCGTAADPAFAEKAERSLFLAALVTQMDDFREQMQNDWAAFSDELHHRILPALHATDDVSIAIISLQKTADDVREQCLAWPGAVQAEFAMVAARVAAAAAVMALPKRWREKQDLLNHFRQLERRLRRDGAVERDVSLASIPGDSSPGFMDVALFFCTLRAPSGRRTPADFFGIARAAAPSEGLVRVSLPDFDGVASNGPELPFGWTHHRKRATGNTSKSLEISACIVLDIEHFVRHVAACREPGGRATTVFVHGFNSTFANSALKMALYPYKMREHAIVLFGWPSFQLVDQYGGDEAHAMWAVPLFVAFMKRLLTSYRLEKVHVLAHSMGSRVALYGLARLIGWKAPKGAARLGQLVLAAPDFDTGEFFDLQAELSEAVERITVYCSANDQALHLSARVHGGLPRLGNFNARTLLFASRHVPLADNVDVIDATGFVKSVIGHTYVFTHTGVLDDVCAVFRCAAASSRRAALRPERFEEAFRYWRFVGGAERPAKAEQENVESELCEENAT